MVEIAIRNEIAIRQRIAPTMTYNGKMNQNKPQRKSIRLPNWDYRTAAFYFVTICTYERKYIFNDTKLQEIAANAWAYIPEQPHAQHIELDEWVIMPNHIHGIIYILINPNTAVPQHPSRRPPSGSLGAIIGNYKMLVTKRVKAMLKSSGTDMKVWQRGYYERIIRNERELNATRQYIQNNPIRWQEDRDNLDQLLPKMQYIDIP